MVAVISGRGTRRRHFEPRACQCNKLKHHRDSEREHPRNCQRCECNADHHCPEDQTAETAIVRKLIKRFNKWRSEI
jgi:hypothetical protein